MRSFSLTPDTRSLIAVGWSPAGSKSETILIATPPSDFSGRAGRWGTHISPFLCSGFPDSISADSAATVAVTPEFDSELASSSEMSIPATGLRPAAARSLAVAAPPIDVPRAVLVGAEERSGIFFFGLAGALSASREISLAQSEIDPVSGVPLSSACGASSKPLSFRGDFAMPGIWDRNWEMERVKQAWKTPDMLLLTAGCQ